MTESQAAIIKKALEFWNEYEVEGNMGFKNPYFEGLMKMTGWQMGQAWCMYFVELVFREAGFKEKADIIPASAVTAFRTLSDSKLFTAHNTPQPADIALWQTFNNGVGSWSGHGAIVLRAYKDRMITIEGNTNAEGGRDGVSVSFAIRQIDFLTNNGLRLLGFIR